MVNIERGIGGIFPQACVKSGYFGIVYNYLTCLEHTLQIHSGAYAVNRHQGVA